MAFNLTKPIWAQIFLHDVTQESVEALIDHFTHAFVRENIAGVYDVVATFKSLTLTSFCLEKSSARKGIFLFLRNVFSVI